MNYRECDEKVFSIIEEFGDQAALLELSKSDFPQTFRALFSFIAKTDAIKSAMFEMADSENIYGMKILYRSLIEHFLKFQYILYRFILEKNDAAGEDFYLFCGAIENVEFANALRASEAIFGKDNQFDAFQFIKEKNPKLKRFSNNEIKRKSEQFKHRNIVKYIKENVDSLITSESSLLLNTIPIYSELSSFIHGGPHTEWFTSDVISSDEDQKLVIQDARMAFLISSFVKAFSFLAFTKVNTDCLKVFVKINAVVDLVLKSKDDEGT